MSDSVAMNNAVETPSTTLSENCLSITEIKKRYRKLNKNLIEVMDRIEDIINRECFDENDRKYLKNRDCSFVQYKLNQKEIEIYGISLDYDLLVSMLGDAIKKSYLFFESENSMNWESTMSSLKKKILIFNEDTTILLLSLNNLYQSLYDIIYYIEFENILIQAHSEENNRTYYSTYFNIDAVHSSADDENDIQLKRNIYYKAIAEKKLLCLKLAKDPDTHSEYIEFQEKCLNAISIIDELIKNTSNTEIINSTSIDTISKNIVENIVENTPKNPEFTTSRQVLAMYYIFNELDKATNSIDRTVKTRFIHFLTNKSEDNIYKTLAEPFKGLDNKTNKSNTIKDLEYIKNHFNNLGLYNIVNKINGDMKEY